MSRDPATLVNATILFADLIDSVAISAVLDFWGYDELITQFQKYSQDAADKVGSGLVAECVVAGDQLALFLYDRAQVERNHRIMSLPEEDPERLKLEEENHRSSDEALFCALRAAIMLKNAWLSAPTNFERVSSRHLPFDLGIGIHNGICVLRERAGGGARIEGFAINFAKRIEGFARMARVTRVMLSRGATQRLRFVRRKKVVMRQRLGFISHSPEEGALKGLQHGLELFELKFFHRLSIYPSEEQIPVFEKLLRLEPTSVWAYHMAVEHFAYKKNELERAKELAVLAMLARPDSEKIYYDLATIAKKQNELEQARFYIQQALAVNPKWDLPYGFLAELEEDLGSRERDKVLEYLLRAYALVPDSPQNCYDLGEAYYKMGKKDEACKFIHKAVLACPEYLKDDEKLKVAEDLGIDAKQMLEGCK
jgi:tetratricopeptide (TPR) repeat protein